MRKITIPVSAVLALSAIQVGQAATITVDFSKAPSDGSLITQGSVELNGFTFVGNNSKVTLGSGGFYTGGSSSTGARHIHFTPSKNGTITVKGFASADNIDRYIFVATAPGSDANASTVLGKVAIPAKGGTPKELKVSGLAAGTEYYICLAGNGTISAISYEEATPSKDVDVTVKNGKTEGTAEITLNEGIYKVSADGVKALEVSEGKEVFPDNNAVIVKKNGTKLTVKVTVDKVSKDTKYAVSCAISDASLNEVKSVYTQKIAVMINKANVYTNDSRLQELALKASSLMAEANGMGIAQYDEYKTTGKIAGLDTKIADLTADINNATAAYNGYVYAQKKYGNKYENGEWVLDEANTTSLLAKKAELDAAYKNAQENIKEEAALAAIKVTYDNAVAALDNFKKTIDAEYADGKQTNLDTYKAYIDGLVGKVKEGETAGTGVMGTLDDAKNAIVNGDGNALSYANVNKMVNEAKAKYDEEANKLYNLLADNAEWKDGDTYRDMYVESLGKLNEYLRTINAVKADNEALYKEEKCTAETQAAFEERLAAIDGIGAVYTEYEAKASTLRANYKSACEDIKTNLTEYLASQIEDVIGKKDGKDYARTEVSNFYNEQINAIKSSINTIQTNVNGVNEKHTIGNGTDQPYYANYVAEKDAVIATIDALSPKVKKSVREFDNWESSKAVVSGLQTEFNKQKDGDKNAKVTGVKNNVSKDKLYKQATKFSAEYERTIQERINALSEAANASFKADGTGTAEDFFSKIANNQEKDGKVTLYGSTAIGNNIAGYAKAAADALDKYEKVVAALADYDVALNGKPAVGKEGDKDYQPAVIGLKDVATNLDVTVNGEFEGKTYGEYIAEVEKKIGATEGLKKQLDDAVAKNDTAHVQAMAALATFDDLVAEIQTMQNAYADNEKAWNKAQLAQAKLRMLDEAERRVGVIDTKNAIANEVYKDKYNTEVDPEQESTNTTSYEKTTYGKWVEDQTVKEGDKNVKKDGLATLLKKCNDAVAKINTKIENAKSSTDDAAAIAILSEVVEDLKAAEGQYNELSKKAADVKTAYTAEKVARKELCEAIDGIDGKGGIIDELAKVTFDKNGTNMFATESANQSAAIAKLQQDIEAKFIEETVVANKEALTKAKDAIVTAVDNLKGLVAKETANKNADDAYVTKDTELNITKAVTDAKAAIAQAVTDKKAVQDSDAYNYFLNTLLKGYEDDYITIGTSRTTANNAVTKVFEKDGKTVLSGALDEAKYTDPAKNMTAVGEGLQGQLATLKTNIGGVAEMLIACEAEYKNQTDKADAIDKLRKEVFDIITGSETSGYHEEALAELKKIDADIAAYKTAVGDAYKKGTNATGKADIEAAGNNVETALNTLKSGWNDAYSKAVAEDNKVRKGAFDDAYTELTKTYAEDVDVIARLSKLSYADNFGDELKEVVGPDGIYTYADKIRDLKTRTENAYASTVAPALFDGGEKFKQEANEMKAKIDEITTHYTKLVNEFAEQTYTEAAAGVQKKLDDAKIEVANKLGSEFADKTFLTDAFEDVQTIIDEAKGYNEKTEDGDFVYADFAEKLDKEVLPKFNTVDGKITADKTQAAKDSYNTRMTSYRTLANSEAKAIAGYNGEDGKLGAFSEEYKTFVAESIDKAEALWATIADADKYTAFDQVAEKETESVKSALAKFGTPAEHAGYNKDDKDQPAAWAEKHTAKYWKAYDADQKYHANDNSYAAMQTEITSVQAALDKAEEFVESLIIRNNTAVTNRLDNAQTAIDALETEAEGYHTSNTAEAQLAAFKEKCKKQIEDINLIVEGKSTGALLEESTAVEVQIGFLQHDYNQAAAVMIDNADFDSKLYKDQIAAFSKRNTEILRDFKEGKVDGKGAPIYVDGKPVYATAEETRLAFIALETEVGQLKSELTAIYNAAAATAAQEAVQKEIDALTATYDEFVAQLADCHKPVQDEYQAVVDAFKAEIDALQAVLDKEVADNTVLLYQDENAATADKIAKSVADLSKAIADMEAPYDVNDAQYLVIRGQLNTLTESLEKVNTAVQGYEYQQKGVYDTDINGDGEIGEDEKFDTYAKKYYALYTYQIAKDRTWLDEQNEKFALTATSTPTDYSIEDITDGINAMDKQCAYWNASSSISKLTTDLADAKRNIDNLGYTDADKETLKATYSTLNTAITNLNTYNEASKENFVRVDIDGKPIIVDDVVGKTVVYMEEYPAIMAKVAAVATDVAALAKDAIDMSWIKGDVDHNSKITVADYDAVRQIILEILKPEETSAMFYAADVNNDRLVNVGDLTLIGKNIMEGEPFPTTSAGTASAAMAKSMSLGIPTYGTLDMTAEGSGLTQTVKVAVNSQIGFVGGQFDVVLPAGVKLASVASSSHDALMGEVNGAVRVLVSNLENTEIVNGQTFVELNVEVSADYNGGGIEVQNAKFADADGTVFSFAKSSIGTPTGLTNLTVTEKVQSKVYSVGGMLMNKMKKGINIIVNSDGTTKKQVIE